jgi:hypothetical protein
MDSMVIAELTRVSQAATEAGLHEWAYRFLVAGGLMIVGLLLARWGRSIGRNLAGVRRAMALLLVLNGGVSLAQEPMLPELEPPSMTPDAPAPAPEFSEEEMNARLKFIETRLKGEAFQARAWEIGWSAVYVLGFGYGIYQLGTSTTRSGITDGVVGMVKTGVGTLGLALNPLHTGRGAHPLDGVPQSTPEELRHKVELAERLLLRNAHEADIRYSWKPHLISITLSLAGGIAIWAAGDFWKGAESFALGSSVGEITIWTRPWKARRDLRAYRHEFGEFVGEGTASSVGPASALRAGPSGLRFTF